MKSASDAGIWVQGVVKFGCGDKGDQKWRRGEIVDGSGVDYVFLLREAYSHLKKGDQVKFQVQHNTWLQVSQAINILLESGAPLAPAAVTSDKTLFCNKDEQRPKKVTGVVSRMLF